MLDKSLSWLGALWFTSGTIMVFSDWSFSVWLNQANTLLLTLGGTAILLYQRKLAADQKVESSGNYRDLRAQIDDLVTQRDREQERANHLYDQVNHLIECSEKQRCNFPLADGTARCTGKEFPPL